MQTTVYVTPPLMENHTDKETDNNIETGVIEWFRDIRICQKRYLMSFW